MILQAERLILRPWDEADAESLYEYAKDDRVGPIAGWPPHTSVENSREIIRTVLSEPETYAVCLKKDNRAIGSIGLMIGKSSNLDLPENEGEIGYWIGVPFWGQGLIPEAVRELIRRAFNDLHLVRLWCGYFDGNEKSKRCQEKCGFVYHHTNKDIHWKLMDDIRTEHITCLEPRIRETFYTSDRAEWRRWLSENFETKSEVWFVFPMKGSGEASLSYNDAVEEALCFGWIDSTTGHLDKTHGVRRFTPRKDFSYYSRPNIERLIWLDKQGLIHPKVRPSVAEVIEAEYVFPEDILDAIRADEVTWENYQKFTNSYKRIRVAYIDAARKRPKEFQKRLDNFIARTRANKMIVGFGGIEKYYK